MWRKLIMGRINFGWLAGFRPQTGSVAKATFVRLLGEAAAPGEGVRAVPLNIVYPGICLTI